MIPYLERFKKIWCRYTSPVRLWTQYQIKEEAAKQKEFTPAEKIMAVLEDLFSELAAEAVRSALNNV